MRANISPAHGFYFHFTVTSEYLIAGGDFVGATRLTEVVELVKTNSTPSFGQLPYTREGAVGAMFGNAPILCGGYGSGTYLDSCISFQNSQWNPSYSMNEPRLYAAGVQINFTTFWILGGQYNFGSNVFLDSTEFIIEGQTNGVPGPKLPYGLFLMCAVKLSEEEIFVIAGMDGNDNASNEVWIYDLKNGFARKQGRSLNIKRFGHSCSTMRDSENTFIIVAGGATPAGGYLDSVEIYNPSWTTWHSGKTNSQLHKLFYLLFFNQNDTKI